MNQDKLFSKKEIAMLIGVIILIIGLLIFIQPYVDKERQEYLNKTSNTVCDIDTEIIFVCDDGSYGNLPSKEYAMFINSTSLNCSTSATEDCVVGVDNE